MSSSSGSTSSSFNIPGLGSGIDWSVLVDAMKKQEQQKLQTTYLKRQALLTKEQASLAQVKSGMDQMRILFADLQVAKDFKSKSATTSDDSVVTASAEGNAISQAFTVRVDELATNEVWQASFSGVDNAVTSSDQTLSITVRGKVENITVTAGTSLKGLAEKINNAGIGVTATVYDTGAGGATPARLSITDNRSGKNSPDQTPGANYNLGFSSTLTDLATGDFGTDPVIEGKDSKVYLNGDTVNAVYRDTNVLDDVVPGVVVNLVSVDATAFKTITVTENATNALTKMQNLVDSYNSLVDFVKKLVKIDPNISKETNPTAGNPVLESLLTNMRSALTSSLASLPSDKKIRSLSDLGIETIQSANDPSTAGHIKIDESKFNAALKSNYDDVVSFFEGSHTANNTYQGFGETMVDVTDSFIGSPDGRLVARLNSINAQNKEIDKRVDEAVQRINIKEERMKEKFARMEVALSKLSAQQNSLTGSLASLDGMNKAIKNGK